MADSHAHEASQAAQIRALQDILSYLLSEIETTKSQVRDVARLTQIVSQPELAKPAAYPRHAKPRDRHGLRVIPGGMAALAPVALFCHTAAAPLVALGARLLLRSSRARVLTSMAALALGAALIVPGTADRGTAIFGQLQRRVPAPHCHCHRQYRPDGDDSDNDEPLPGTRPFM